MFFSHHLEKNEFIAPKREKNSGEKLRNKSFCQNINSAGGYELRND